MRPNQHKNRQRSRGRRQGSSSNRSYESNGPDVKVRGTAQHIAEKYLQLGRDAQASGDPVMSESYFQHAEHYLRIVAASQPPQYQSQNAFQGGDDQADDDEQPEVRVDTRQTPPGSGPQPEVGERKQRGGKTAKRNGSDGDSQDGDGADRDGGDGDGGDGWAGPQPSFLQKPAVSDEAGEDKPKRASRSTRTRRSKTSEDEAPADGAGEPEAPAASN